MADGIELAPLITKLKVDTAQFKRDMAKASELGKRESDRVEKNLAGLTKVGQNLSRVGAALTKSVTLPLVGVGVATAKMAVDFESSFAKVSTLLDDGVVDFAQYKKALIDGSNETKIAVGEYSESVYQAISAGVDQRKAVEFTTEAMKLAKGGFTSGASAVDILTTAINGYNLKAEDATKISDMLITTQNLGKTTVDELSNSMGRVIPIASSVNFGMNELSASYAQLTKNGIATAEAGTYMKQMLSELGKSGSVADTALRELTGKGFADLKKEGTATSDILNMLSQHAQQNGKTLKDMFGSVEAGSAALVLAKGNGEEYNAMLRAMNSSAGATQAAFDKMNATPAEKLKGALNELRNSGVKFGASFIPVISQVAGVLSKAADKFDSLSEAEQQNVVKWAAVTAAVGPALKIVGGGITTFTKLSSVLSSASATLGSLGGTGLLAGMGSLASVCLPVVAGVGAVGAGLYAAHEHGQLMKRTVIESSEEMSGMEKIVASLTGTEIYSREELEKMGLVHKEFSEDISKEFQKAVEKSTRKVQEFSTFLKELGFDNVITPQESDDFNSRVEATCQEAISTVQSKKNESQSALKELFVSDNIVDENEQKVLEILSRSSDNQISEIQTLKDEMLAIKQRAVDEGRALNEQEIADLEAKNSRIRQIELEALGGTQEEIAYAKNEFAARIKTMDAQSASELLQEKAKIIDEEIVQIQAAYDTQIEMLKAKAETLTGEEKAAVEAQIANLEADKQRKIDIQNNLYDEYMNIIKENNPKLLDVINQFNGELLTQEDIKAQERLFSLMETYDGMNQITESGCYQLYNTEKGHWENVKVVVDESTGAIVGVHAEALGKTGGYTEQMAQDAENMARRQDGAYKAIGASMGLYVDKGGTIKNANGEVVASMDDLKAHTDGTKQGIVDINGTPYQITVNKDGTISALNQIDAAADKATRPRTLTITAAVSGAAHSALASLSGGSSHFNGLDNVPYDGYRAILHKNERVLTAEENKEYTNGRDRTNYRAIRDIIRSELKEIVIVLNDREFGRAQSRWAEGRG